LGLAQHDYQVKTSRELAAAHRWQNLSFDDQGIWAEIPIKDKPAIQTNVCLTPLSLGCTCVSYHAPCQHALGLLLLWLEHPEVFTKKETPGWITWSEIDEVSEISEANDDQQHYTRIETGLGELEVWLFDLLRSGLEVARGRPAAYYQQMADRLVDAGLGEVAKDIRQLATLTAKHSRWHEDYLSALSKLHLLLQGFKRLNTLPELSKADVCSALGWSPELEPKTMSDHWHVLGRRIESENNRKVQRLYLWGEASQRPALLVTIMHGKKTLVTRFLPGVVLKASLSFHKTSTPLRAELLSLEDISQPLEPIRAEASIKVALEAFTNSRIKNPWLKTYPLALQNVIVEQHEGNWILHDKEGYFMRLPARYQQGWYLRALSANRLWVFGEYDGLRFLPISTWANDHLLELHTLKGIT
jgi:hypothetical protein